MIGNILLTLALMASVFTIIMYYLTNKGYTNTLKLARIGFHTTSISVIAASALLLNAILTHQYQFKYVFNYSSSDLPTGLLMSTFYAGQEGSFLLWILFSVIVGLILLEYTSRRGDLEQRVMMIFTLALGFLLLMVAPGLKSPFTYIWTDPQYVDAAKFSAQYIRLGANGQLLNAIPFLQNFIFTDPGSNQTFVLINNDLVAALNSNGIAFNQFLIEGKGLNPLLQNFWMQIHPPMLFIGFAMSTVPFAFAFSALMKNDYKEWVKQSLPWISAAMMILGLAIMLGGYWAYGVLGWGGYWGWDPVENSSLVPWIVGVASIHTMLIQKKTQDNIGAGRYVKTNLILAILTYILVIYSTFLTRSGILGDASVHSFVDPGMLVYLMLVLFIGTFIILGFGAIAYRWKYLEKTFTSEDNLISRELALFTGSVALLASAIIIIAGTSAPIFGNSVDLSFYNELNLPIAIIIGLINGFSLIIKWRVNDKGDIFKNSRNSLILSVAATIAIVLLGSVYNIMLILLTFASAFALFVNLEILLRIFRKKTLHLGAYVAHAGIALFFMGVISTGGFTQDKQVQLVKGQPKNVLGYNLTFEGYTPTEDGKYAFNIEVEKDNSSTTVSPVMYVAEFNNSLMREPDVLKLLTKDFYISPLSYDEGSQNTHNHSGEGTQIVLRKGESYEFEGKKVTFTAFNFPSDAMEAMQSGKEFFIGAKISVAFDGKTEEVEPRMISGNGKRSYEHAELKAADLKVDMENLDAGGSVTLILSSISGKEDNHNTTPIQSYESLTIDVSVKPFINLVWLGVAVMTAGFMISVIRRTKESRQ
ncbi:MAG: cytochrome c biogenesis protein CcsA [Melioribacteraceae bacterium]|nr:cytochrome c biogenesis protein CcsA [Melioribacteraceae bacterium]